MVRNSVARSASGAIRAHVPADLDLADTGVALYRPQIAPSSPPGHNPRALTTLRTEGNPT